MSSLFWPPVVKGSRSFNRCGVADYLAGINGFGLDLFVRMVPRPVFRRLPRLAKFISNPAPFSCCGGNLRMKKGGARSVLQRDPRSSPKKVLSVWYCRNLRLQAKWKIITGPCAGAVPIVSVTKEFAPAAMNLNGSLPMIYAVVDCC